MRTALVLGGAACVYEDVEAALALGEFQGVVACNEVGIAWPGPLEAWVSLHPEKLGRGWIETRLKLGLPRPKILAGQLTATAARGNYPDALDPRLQHQFPTQRHSGSSGLFAVKVALFDCGFDRAVCCGIPLNIGAGHFFDTSEWTEAHHYRLGWDEALQEIKHRVRSMSGWTRQILGAPAPEWLAGAEETAPLSRVG